MNIKEVLLSARWLIRTHTGNLSSYTKEDADEGIIDAVAWSVQQEIEEALTELEGEKK